MRALFARGREDPLGNDREQLRQANTSVGPGEPLEADMRPAALPAWVRTGGERVWRGGRMNRQEDEEEEEMEDTYLLCAVVGCGVSGVEAMRHPCGAMAGEEELAARKRRGDGTLRTLIPDDGPPNPPPGCPITRPSAGRHGADRGVVDSAFAGQTGGPTPPGWGATEGQRRLLGSLTPFRPRRPHRDSRALSTYSSIQRPPRVRSTRAPLWCTWRSPFYGTALCRLTHPVSEFCSVRVVNPRPRPSGRSERGSPQSTYLRQCGRCGQQTFLPLREPPNLSSSQPKKSPATIAPTAKHG